MAESETFKSDRILEEIKKRKTNANVEEKEETKVKLVVFTLGGHYYALMGNAVKEILTVLKVFPVPSTPEFILGIINVRGEIQSVLDVSLFMGLPATTTTPTSRIVIADQNAIRSGILVDSVEDVLDVPETAMQKTISTLNDSIKYFVAGEMAYGHQTVTILDAGKLFEKMTEAQGI